jgi:dTDP-4-dehydrorhamnose 3,5-epimerase
MVYKNFFTGFPDERGFLNPFDLRQLLETIKIPNFNLRYQLISFSEEKNVFRGFHFQKKPYEQTKILIVHKGSIKDILFPIENSTKSSTLEYDLEAGDVIVIPNNYAHGFYTKSSNVLLQYLMDQQFSPEHYTGFSPLGYIENHSFDSNPIVSDKDKSLPQFRF